MPTDGRELDVLLGEVPVGRLALEASGVSSFAFFDSYRARYPRPVLGQAFEDDLFGRYLGKGGKLPVWFSNLLPEEPLRTKVQAELPRRRKHELFMLQLLAEDLPGALRVVTAHETESAFAQADYESSDERLMRRVPRRRFSLAGVQPKLPVLRRPDGTFAIPPHDVDGDWIAKLPHLDLAGTPKNEHAMMTWAKLAGLDVPDVELVAADAIDGLDPGRLSRREPIFVVRRFDRAPGGVRIHIEDFAQVLGIYPDDKYEKVAHYRAIGRVVRAVAGDDGFDEFVRRLVFVVASGNADMHHKNWSLRYPDGVHAALAPAYDFVAVVAYADYGEELALKLAGSKRWKDVRTASFADLADESEASRERTLRVVEETLDAIASSREEARSRSHMTAEAWGNLQVHWRHVPLLRSRA